MTKPWTYYSVREHDDDRWIYEHFAFNTETRERKQLDVSSNRSDISVEEWLLHVELGFPSRGDPMLKGIGPLEHTHLLHIKNRRAQNHD